MAPAANVVFYGFNVTLVTPDKRVDDPVWTCRRINHIDKTTRNYRGQLQLLVDDEADTIMSPFAMDLEKHEFFFGPVLDEEYSSFMNLYNTSYKTRQVLTMFQTYSSTTWLLILLMFLSYVLMYSCKPRRRRRKRRRRLQFKTFNSLFIVVRMFLNRPGLDERLLKRRKLRILTFMVLFSIYVLTNHLCNSIKTDSLIPVNTTQIETLQDLLSSSDHRPIWMYRAMIPVLHQETSRFYNAIVSRVLLNGNKTVQRTRNIQMLFEGLKYRQMVFVGISPMIQIISAIVKRRSYKDLIHQSKTKFSRANFAYPLNRNISHSTRSKFESHHHRILHSGISIKLKQFLVRMGTVIGNRMANYDYMDIPETQHDQETLKMVLLLRNFNTALSYLSITILICVLVLFLEILIM